jgi:Zinc-finger of RNA-polymerase I-specific TFIIB, Rrn7
LEFDGQGPYCQECYHQRPPCDICNAPLTDEHWQLSDGRTVCARCHATAIYTPAEAVALYNQMKDATVERLGLTLNIPTGVALVDRNQLRQVIRLQKDPGRDSPSTPLQVDSNALSTASALELDADRTLGLYARRGMRRGIYIQTGLPRLLFLQVAAHEYAHAWQGENIPTLRDGLEHEGFAEWVAYKVLGFYGYQQGQERMLRRQDLYGQGLRWALDEEAAQGYLGVIEACRRAA